MPAAATGWPLLDEILNRYQSRKILTSNDFEALADELKGTAGRLAGVMNVNFTKEIYESLHQAIMDGKTVRDFAVEAQKILDKYGAAEGLKVYTGDRFSPSYVDMVFRTNTASAQAAGRYAEMFTPEWMELEPYWQYSAIEDDRVRPEHAALDGKVFRKDDEAARHYLPPWDFNCLPFGALVSGRFSGAFKTRYTGPMVKVTTRRGNRLTVTANHPVLTPGGFVRADNLKEGDYLVCNTGGVEDNIDPDRAQKSLARILGSSDDVFLSDRDHIQNRPAEVGELFEAFKLVGPVLHAPCRPDDLYGDAVFGDGQVEAVLLNRKLPGCNDAAISESFEDLEFSLVDESKSFESSPRALGLDIKRNLFASDSGPRSGALASDGIGITLEPTPFKRLGSALSPESDAEIPKCLHQDTPPYSSVLTELQNGLSTDVPGRESWHVGKVRALALAANPSECGSRNPLDSVLVEDSLGACFADAESLCQPIDPASGSVGIDQIVLVDRFWFSGHVYDLQSPYGWILAQNIYVSNCRCTSIPLLQGDVDRENLKVSSGADIPKIPLKDANGKPLLDKNGLPQKLGRPPEGWDADRVESLVPGVMRGAKPPSVPVVTPPVPTTPAPIPPPAPLPVQIPPHVTPPVPTAHPALVPVGTPVSTALDKSSLTKAERKEFQRVTGLIDSVHGDGKMAPTTAIYMLGRSGSYAGSRIEIGAQSAERLQQIVHEIGHKLDLEAMPGKGFTSEIPFGELADVLTTIRASKAVKNLQALPQGAITPHINYLLSDVELWARAYAQFIAEESGDPALLAEIRRIQTGKTLRQPDAQWDPVDFAPIRAKIRALMRRLGWVT